jgi:hypothetical protein
MSTTKLNSGRGATNRWHVTTKGCERNRVLGQKLGRLGTRAGLGQHEVIVGRRRADMELRDLVQARRVPPKQCRLSASPDPDRVLIFNLAGLEARHRHTNQECRQPEGERGLQQRSHEASKPKSGSTSSRLHLRI